MKLYFLPLACSLASRIALRESGLDIEFVPVDPIDKTLPDGRPYREVHGLELVPALELDDGKLLTENIAVLSHISDRSDALRPAEAERERLLSLLSFIATELHSGVFRAMFDRAAPAAVREHALQKAPGRLEHAENLVAGRTWLLDRFSVADAYLLTVLNWAQATPIDLTSFPELRRYLEAGRSRPSVQRAMQLELPLYLEERERQRTAEVKAIG